MPNAAPRPAKMFLPLGLVLLLAVLWTVYWFAASQMAQSRLAAERARLAQRGLTLACTEEAWGGFPFHFEFTCTSPVVTYGNQAELRSEKLLLVALAYAPWQVVALVDGPSTVTGQGITPTRIDHERAIAAVTFGKDWQPQMSSEIPKVSVAGLGKADKVMLHSRPAPDSPGTEVALIITKLDYAPPGKPALALDQASLIGTLAPDQSFKVEKAEIQQGPLRYWGTGTLTLDPQHRAAGQLETETNDINALLALLSPHIDLSDNQKGGLKTMLGLLGNEAKAPVIAKDGVLYLGPFKLRDLPPLY